MARPPATATRLAAAGAGYIEAARYLAEHAARDDGMEHWPAAFVNIGFACELGLKAAILQLGGSEGDLHAVGHDLVRALLEARQRGLDAQHPAFDQLVDTLGPPFSNMHLRYLLGDEVDLLPLPDAFAIARELYVRCGRVVEPNFAAPVVLTLI